MYMFLKVKPFSLSLRFQYRIGKTVSKIVISTCKVIYDVLRENYLMVTIAIIKVNYKGGSIQIALAPWMESIQPPGYSGSTFCNFRGRFTVALIAAIDANYKFVCE